MRVLILITACILICTTILSAAPVLDSQAQKRIDGIVEQARDGCSSRYQQS